MMTFTAKDIAAAPLLTPVVSHTFLAQSVLINILLVDMITGGQTRVAHLHGSAGPILTLNIEPVLLAHQAHKTEVLITADTALLRHPLIPIMYRGITHLPHVMYIFLLLEKG